MVHFLVETHKLKILLRKDRNFQFFNCQIQTSIELEIQDFFSLGKLLSSKFGIQKLTKGKFLNYFVGNIFGNFSGNQKFISRKKDIFME